MSRVLRFARHQALALVAIAIAMSSVAYAASLQLATTNTANKTTTLRNTGNGPALRLNVKAGQPPLAVSSGKVVPKLNASKLQGKVPANFAPAGSSYTKAQSDLRYAKDDASYTKAESDLKYAEEGTSYTKAESDLKYADEGASYTKAQSDAKYALPGTSYTTTQSDARYPRVLVHESFAGGLDSNGATDVYDETINVPGSGTALIFIDRTFGGGGGFVNVYVAGEFMGGELDIPYSASPGGFTLRVQFGSVAAPANVTGHVTVLFIPD